MPVKNIVKLSQLTREARFDAEFYQPLYVAREASVARLSHEPLGKLAGIIRRGVQPQYEEDGTVPVIRTVNVRELALSSTRQQHVTEAFSTANPRAHVRKGDIVVTSTGIGTLGRVAYVDADTRYFADGHIAYLRDIQGIDPLYLVTFLQSAVGRSLIERRQRGSSGQMEVYTDDLESIPIPRLGKAEARVVECRKAAFVAVRQSYGAIAAAEARLMEAVGLGRLDLSPQKCYTRRFRDLEAAGRFGAEYFMPCKTRILAALAKMPHKTVEAHAPGIRDMYDPTRARKGEMVRNFDITDALEPFLDDSREPEPAIEMGSSKKRFQAGDVVVSRLRSYLKEIAVVRTSGTPQSVGSSEYIVLRPTGKGLSPETLMVYLRCPLVQTILKWSQDGSNHPRFTEEDLLAIPVPDKVLGVQKQIDGLVNKAIEARIEAARLLEQAKKTVEDLIAGNP